MEGASTVSSASGWFGPDSNPPPGQSSGSITAPTVTTTGC
jgi:hypothetical protein